MKPGDTYRTIDILPSRSYRDPQIVEIVNVQGNHVWWRFADYPSMVTLDSLPPMASESEIEQHDCDIIRIRLLDELREAVNKAEHEDVSLDALVMALKLIRGHDQ